MYRFVFIVLLNYWLALILAENRNPGEITPDRVEIASGDNVDIYCAMNPSVLSGKNASNLKFYDTRNNEPIASELVDIVNSTTIVYRMRNAEMQKTIIRCKCDAIAIMDTKVFVGLKPEAITDFTCRSYDYNYMMCNFTTPQNPVFPQYNLSFYTSSPEYTNFIACDFLYSPLVMCNISQGYRSCTDQYHFILRSENSLGKRVQYFNVSNVNEMILARPGQDLHISNGYPLTNAIRLVWRMPKSDLCRSNNLQWEIMLQPDNFLTQNITNAISVTRSRKDFSLYLNDLPYAYYWYTLRMRVKVKSSSHSEDMWSEPMDYRFRTAGEIPIRAPNTNVGSFYIDSAETQVRLYWEELLPHEYNGNNFSYIITEVQRNDELIFQKPLQMEMNSALFEWQKDAKYTFQIHSRNHMGISLASSQIVVYPYSYKNYKPRSIHNLYHDMNRTYTLTWEAPIITERLSNYTVYWCHSKRALQNECNGSIHFAVFPVDVQRFTTAPQDHTLNLAVSANYENYNTGIHWTACTTDVNSDLVKMEPEAHAMGPGILKIEWSPESVCPSILNGYNLTYCEVSDGPEQECTDTPSIVHKDRNARKAFLNDLKPYTNYKIEMLMYSSKKIGKLSEPLYKKTLETAPSAPRRLTVDHITNSSAQLTWLPPSLMNGIIREYIIKVNNQEYKIAPAPPGETINFNLTNLLSFTSYKVYVIARTIANSPYADIDFTTLIGYPSMPGNTVVRNTINDTTLQWLIPTSRSGRLEFYEVAVTQTRNKEVIDRRISFIVGETSCMVKSLECTDPAMKTKFEVRAINAASLTHEVYLDSLDGINSQLDNYYNEDKKSYHRNKNDLLCIGEKHTPSEAEYLVAPYRDISIYRLYPSAWQFVYENSCSSKSSTNAKMVLIFLVLISVTVLVAYKASRKCKNMASISCKLPPGLDTLTTTKNGPPHGWDIYDNEVKAVITNNVAAIESDRSVSIGCNNEKRHLLEKDNLIISANDSTHHETNKFQHQLDDGSETTITTIDSSRGSYFMRTHSDCSDHSALDSCESSLEAVEMEQVIGEADNVIGSRVGIVAPASYIDSHLLRNCYIQPNKFNEQWPFNSVDAQSTQKQMTENCGGYISPQSLKTNETIANAKNSYVQSLDLQGVFNNSAGTPLPNNFPSNLASNNNNGYMTLDALQKISATMTTPLQTTRTVSAAMPTSSPLHSTMVSPSFSYVNPTNLLTKYPTSVESPRNTAICGYVTPRDLNAIQSFAPTSTNELQYYQAQTPPQLHNNQY